MDVDVTGSNPVGHPNLASYSWEAVFYWKHTGMPRSSRILLCCQVSENMSMSDKELYWLAGLLEGEGSFLPGPPSAPNTVGIALTMTDEDVVARVAALWGVTYHEVRRNRSTMMGWKAIFYVHLRGKRAAELMQRLRPLMGLRRQRQIERALASYNPHLRRKLYREQIAEIKTQLAQGRKHGEIASQYGVDRSTISHIKAGIRSAYR